MSKLAEEIPFEKMSKDRDSTPVVSDPVRAHVEGLRRSAATEDAIRINDPSQTM